MIIYISESGRANKKWKAETEGHRAVHFGQRGADDFTIHRDEARPTSPGTAARRTGAGQGS